MKSMTKQSFRYVPFLHPSHAGVKSKNVTAMQEGTRTDVATDP